MITEELLRFDYCKIKPINMGGVICVLETSFDNMKELANDLDILKTNTGCVCSVKIHSKPFLTKDGQVLFSQNAQVVVNIYQNNSLTAELYKDDRNIRLFII